jgi:DNA-binding CsgD family transcriptional regulator
MASVDLERYATASRAMLDHLGACLVVFDAAGHELLRNAAFVRLLERHIALPALEQACQEMACRVAAAPYPTMSPPQSLPTGQGTFLLNSVPLPPGMFTVTGSVLVMVEPPSVPDVPVAEGLRSRFGLTRREAEVAVLLIQGLTNEEVAARLFISSHTARHHTENILTKLNLRSRTGIAFRLLHGVPTPT